jgi:CRISPR/Cas system-associated exonuclease Cas4 (RecB family)
MKSIRALSTSPEKQAKPVLSPEHLEDLLIEIVDQELQKRNTPSFKKMEYFRPSQTNQCSRFWYYMFDGVEVTPKFSSKTYRIFDNGHAVHDRLYKYFRECGILVAEEIPVSWDDPPIQGTADGIIDLHGHRLIELKSISAEGFAYRQMAKKPTDDHFRQAQIYMKCLNLDTGFVIYENKNNQQILPVFIERDDSFLDKLFKKYKKIYGNYVKGEIPEHPYRISSKNCSSCDLKDHCWAENSVDKKDEPF